MYKNRKDTTINTKVLRALCDFENYDKFTEELSRIIKKGKKRNAKYCLFEMMQGKKFIGHKDIKRFLNDYKKEIEIIKKYECEHLILFRYSIDGEINDNSSDVFFSYIKQNKNKINDIKKLIDKIIGLNIENISLCPLYKFNEETHKIYIDYKDNPSNNLRSTNFVFADNVEIIPNYGNDSIKYKTNNSNYCLSLRCDWKSMELDMHNSLISLNNLFFNPDLLPDKIDLENTLGKIISLAKQAKKDKDILRDCVDINVGIEDLYVAFLITSKKIELTNSEDAKQILKEKLYEIRNALTELNNLGQSVEDTLINNSENVTKEKIKDEKKLLYLKNRLDIDFD